MTKKRETKKKRPRLKAATRVGAGARKTAARSTGGALSRRAGRASSSLSRLSGAVSMVMSRVSGWIEARGGLLLFLPALVAILALVPALTRPGREMPLVLAGLGIFALAWSRRFAVNDYSFLNSALDVLALAVVVVYAGAAVGAVSVRSAVGEALRVALFFSLYWAVSRSAVTPDRRAVVMGVMSAGAAGLALAGVAGFPLEVGSSSAVFVTGLACSLVLYAGESRTPRVLWSLVSFLAMFGLVVSGSLAATLCAVVVYVLVLAAMNRRWRAGDGGPPLAPVIGAAVGAGLVLGGLDLWVACVAGLAATALMTRGETSIGHGAAVGLSIACLAAFGAASYFLLVPGPAVVTDLLVGFEEARHMLIDRPLLGAGGGAWPVLHPGYRSFFHGASTVPGQLAKVGIETGVTGLVVFLGLWVIALRALFRIPAHDADLRGAALGGLVALFLLSLAYTTADAPGSGLYLWLLLGLVGAGGRQRTARTRANAGDYRLIPRLAVYGSIFAVAALSFTLAAGAIQADRGQALMASGRYGDAHRALESAVQYDVLSAEYMAVLGGLQHQVGLARESSEVLGQAAYWLRSAVEREPLNLSHHIAFARFSADVGWEEEAARHFTTALDLDPTYQGRYDELAMFLSLAAQRQKGWGDEALLDDYLAQCLGVRDRLAAAHADWPAHLPPEARLPADTPVINLSLGQITAMAGDVDEAARLLEMASDVDMPTRAEALLWLAGLMELEGDVDGAAEMVSPLLEERPDLAGTYSDVRYLLGLEEPGDDDPGEGATR